MFSAPIPAETRAAIAGVGRDDASHGVNAADAVMHCELAEIWRDVDADP